MERRTRILLLEDDDQDRTLIERSLRNFPKHIDFFSSAALSCEFLKNNKVDVVLCDLKVDDSHGIETFRSLQQFAGEAAILVLSGVSRDEVAIQAVQEGAQDFILKSDISVLGLELKIRLALERSGLRKKLKTAEEKSSKQSHFKTEFLADFSHEIRTPLNAVIGAASLLQDTSLDDEQNDLVETLLLGGERLLSIVNDILDISKVESGKFDLEYTTFEVRELVGEILAIFNSQVHSKNIYFIDYVDPSVPAYIESDSKRIKQILLNLVSNAYKFTDEGCISISVDLNGDNQLRFCVSDTGRGIPESKISTLFQPFSQTEKADADNGTGLGLAVCQKLSGLLGGEIGAGNRKSGPGSEFWFTVSPQKMRFVTNKRQNILSNPIFVMSENKYFKEWIFKQLLSRELNVVHLETTSDLEGALKSVDMDSIVILDDVFLDSASKEAHFKNIKLLKNSNNKITTIGFSQPTCEENNFIRSTLHHSAIMKSIAKILFGGRDGLNKIYLDSADKVPQEAMPLKGACCLVVDDDPVNRKIATKILLKLGIQSMQATDGREAIEMLNSNQQHYDFIFMDCTMPEMNGYEASQHIRSQGADVVIVALTAHAFEEDKKKCLDAGMNLFLSKPICVSDVKDVVQKIFELKEKS